jgi:hypothetical protein
MPPQGMQAAAMPAAAVTQRLPGVQAAPWPAQQG